MITFRGSRGDRQGSTSLCRRSQGAAFAPRAPAPHLVVAGHDPRAAFAPTCPRLSLARRTSPSTRREPERQRTFPTPTYLSPILLGVKLRRMGERYVHATKVRSRRQPWLTSGALRPARSALRRNHSSASWPSGPLPARSPDRSHSAPRSVRLRLDDSRGHCLPSRRAGRAGCAARSQGRRTALPGTAGAGARCCTFACALR